MIHLFAFDPIIKLFLLKESPKKVVANLMVLSLSVFRLRQTSCSRSSGTTYNTIRRQRWRRPLARRTAGLAQPRPAGAQKQEGHAQQRHTSDGADVPGGGGNAGGAECAPTRGGCGGGGGSSNPSPPLEATAAQVPDGEALSPLPAPDQTPRSAIAGDSDGNGDEDDGAPAEERRCGMRVLPTAKAGGVEATY